MDKVRELTMDIIDSVEALLEEKDIVIPSDDRKGYECEARIYGKEYYELEDYITESVNKFLKAEAWNNARLTYIRSCVKLLLSDEDVKFSLDDVEKYVTIIHDVYMHHIENHLMEFTIEDIAEIVIYQDLDVLESMDREKLLNLVILSYQRKTAKDEFEALMKKLDEAVKIDGVKIEGYTRRELRKFADNIGRDAFKVILMEATEEERKDILNKLGEEGINK